MGPLGSFLEPFGRVGSAEASECFGRLAAMLVSGGVDCISIETMTDVRELRLAAAAARRAAPGMTLLLHMSFESGGRTLTGTPPGVLADMASAFSPVIAGVNCGRSLEDNREALSGLLACSPAHVSFQPNAGLPVTASGRVEWPATPSMLAEAAHWAASAGAAVVGSCCGSTPEHTREIALAVRGMPVPPRPARRAALCSRTTLVTFADRFVVVGERLNPSGRRRLAEAIREGRTGTLVRSASEQADAGADALDLNVGIGDPEFERAFMPLAVRALDRSVTLPFLIDSPVPVVIAAGLPEYAARPLVNSVPCIESRLEEQLPVIAAQGAAFVALLMSEEGVPEAARDRIRLLDRILERAARAGLTGSDVIVDPVVLSEAVSPGASRSTLETLAEIRRYGLPTILGLSNCSFGLPHRSQVNSAMLAAAAGAGLSAAIMDPRDADSRMLAEASRMLGGLVTAEVFASSAGPARAPAETPDPREQVLEDALLRGDPEGAASLAIRELEAGASPAEVAARLVPVLRSLGAEYDAGRVFLPRLLACAEAVRACFEALTGAAGEGAPRTGTILMATVEGDVHDIGKNIVAAVLAGYGWKVVDLGRNVPAATVAESAEALRPDAVGLSALLTPSLPFVARTVDLLRRLPGGCPMVIVGGAVVTPAFAESLGVLWGRDGVHGAEVLQAAVEERARSG
jgi:5-methyltetrahydrofolate--homocysteine methyltransferase